MRYIDIAIIGGGLAGSTAAAMLGRAGVATVLIDPHQTYPFDFRVEKINGDEQLGRFYQTGIADSVLRSATRDGENWIARFGYLLDKKPSRQNGIMYDTLIGAIRAEIVVPAEIVYAKVTDVATSAERQNLTLSDGETISARLVVLANGLNVRLRRDLCPIMILGYMPQNLGILVQRLRINADHAATDIPFQNIDRQFRTDPQLPADECVFGKAFAGIEIDVEVFAKATLVERQAHRAANPANRLGCEQRQRATVRHGAVRAYDGQVVSAELVASDQIRQRGIGRDRTFPLGDSISSARSSLEGNSGVRPGPRVSASARLPGARVSSGRRNLGRNRNISFLLRAVRKGKALGAPA
jgi:FAD binding domain